jgi:hypothetical protein
MRDGNNQRGVGFEDVENTERKPPKNYWTSTQEVWTAVFWESRNACHRSFDCCDEVVTETRRCNLVMACCSEKFLTGGWEE